MFNNVLKRRTSPPILPSPQKLGKIRWQHVAVRPPHRFQFCFRRRPERLNPLRVSSCCRIDEVQGVIDGQVLETVIAKRIVGCPLVAMDGRSWPNLLLNDGDQCVGRAILNDNQKGVVCLAIKTAKHPGSIPESATVILPLAKLTLVDLDEVPNATNLVCLREKARCRDLPED